MANPLLRRAGLATFVANTDTTVLAAVPANRAVAISKITVSNITGAAVTFRLLVGGFHVAYDLTLNAGQVYTETGLVALTGETVQARTNTTNGIAVEVFGEEVDNT